MSNASPETVRARRTASIWTRIHPLFAIGQLLAFFVSVSLLVAWGAGAVPFAVVHISVLVKIALMAGAMVTGALWEKDVYGSLWFAPQYMGEDTMTVNVMILHVAYLLMAHLHGDNLGLVAVTLSIAYLVYITNVAQYIFRFRHQHVAGAAA